RSADLQPGPLLLAVPAFWTGLLYEDGAIDDVLAMGRGFDSLAAWRRGMDEAARRGLKGVVDGTPIADLAARAVARSIRSLRSGAACAGSGDAVEALTRLAKAKDLTGDAR